MSKKNNTAAKAIQDAEELSKALKEGTEASIKGIVNEAISNIIKEGLDDTSDDTDNEEDIDVESEDTVSDEEPQEENFDGEEEADDFSDEDETDDEEWSDMEEYKTSDGNYDLSDADGETALKVYNKLGDDDKIIVKKEGDGVYSVQDEETGAEYEIEVDADADEDFGGEEDFDDEDEFSDGEQEFELDVDTDDSDEFEDDDISDEDDELEIDIEDDDSDEFEDEDSDVEFELEDDDEDFDDDEELNEENLGYTTTYQDDVMPGLNMNEPANKKSTYSMDGGAPNGNGRPYSHYKNKESNLFTKNVDESDDSAEDGILDEAGHEIRKSSKSTSGTVAPDNHDEYMAKDSHNVHVGGNTGKTINEAVRRILSKAKEIQAENKQYKDALDNIKKSLVEAAVLNVSLGNALKLVCENTTSQEEKKAIVKRFENVKTINESKELYKTITSELNGNAKRSAILERQMSANDKSLNETTIYNNPVHDYMNRMNKLESMWAENKNR